MIVSTTNQITSKNKFIQKLKKKYIYFKKQIIEKAIIGLIEINKNGIIYLKFLKMNVISSIENSYN